MLTSFVSVGLNSNRGTNPNENNTQGEMLENFNEPHTTKHSQFNGIKQVLSPPIVKKNTNTTNVIVVDRGVVERE
jgi:hypothetical protein